VDSGADPLSVQPVAQRVALGEADHILVKHMSCVHTWLRKHQREFCQARIVTVGDGTAPRIVGRKAPELDREDRRLDRVETRIDADAGANITLTPAIFPHLTQRLGESGVLGDDHAPIAKHTKVFRRIKSEAPDVAE